MDIDDLLKEPRFASLDAHLDEEFLRYTTPEFREHLKDVLESPENARDWFYTRLSIFEYKRPYDLCKEGREEEVNNVLYRIEHGVFS